jgi:hypothetical protein
VESYDDWIIIANQIGLPVVEAMERVTHREYRLRVLWNQHQWNKPNLTEYYLMQIAQHLARLPGAKKLSELGKFKLPFKYEKVNPRKRKPPTKAEHSASVWAAALKNSMRK